MSLRSEKLEHRLLIVVFYYFKILYDLSIIKNTQMTYVPSILTFECASVCLDTLIETAKFTGHPNEQICYRSFGFSKK